MAAAGIQRDVTFEDLVAGVDRVVGRLKQEIANREVLESMADDADDLAPGEFSIYVEFDGRMCKVAPDQLGISSFAPLVEPIRRGSVANALALVDELADACRDLHEFCRPPQEQGAQDDGQQQPGPAAAHAAPPPAAGLLAALQSRRAAGSGAGDQPDVIQP